MNNFFKVFVTTLKMMMFRPMWLFLLASITLTSLPYIYGTLDDMPVGVVDMDRTQLSRELTRMLDAAPKIEVHSYGDLNAARNDLAWMRLFAIIVLPLDMEKRILHGENVVVPVFGDASNRMANGQIQQDITVVHDHLVNRYNSERLQRAGFTAEQATKLVTPFIGMLEDIYNPGISFAAITLPGLVTLILQHGLLMSCTRVNLMLRGGTPRSIRQPVSTRFGRYAVQLLIWLVVAMLVYVIWPHVFGFRQTASYFALLCLIVPFLCSVIALSEFVAEVLPSEEAIYFTLTFITMPLFYLAGYTWPTQAMPHWVAWLANLIPSTWAIRAVAEMNQMNLPLSRVMPNIVMLLILGTGYAVLGTLIYKFRNWKQDEREKLSRRFRLDQFSRHRKQGGHGARSARTGTANAAGTAGSTVSPSPSSGKETDGGEPPGSS